MFWIVPDHLDATQKPLDSSLVDVNWIFLFVLARFSLDSTADGGHLFSFVRSHFVSTSFSNV